MVVSCSESLVSCSRTPLSHFWSKNIQYQECLKCGKLAKRTACTYRQLLTCAAVFCLYAKWLWNFFVSLDDVMVSDLRSSIWLCLKQRVGRVGICGFKPVIGAYSLCTIRWFVSTASCWTVCRTRNSVSWKNQLMSAHLYLLCFVMITKMWHIGLAFQGNTQRSVLCTASSTTTTGTNGRWLQRKKPRILFLSLSSLKICVVPEWGKIVEPRKKQTKLTIHLHVLKRICLEEFSGRFLELSFQVFTI